MKKIKRISKIYSKVTGIGKNRKCKKKAHFPFKKTTIQKREKINRDSFLPFSFITETYWFPFDESYEKVSKVLREHVTSSTKFPFIT